MRFPILVTALFTAALNAATPSTAPTVTPLQQVSPVIRASTPRVTGYRPIGCIGKGDLLTVVGTGFGASQGGRGVALGGRGIRVYLPVEGWSDTRLRVHLPDDPGVQAGQWYFVAVESGDHSSWLSNTDRNLQICAGNAVLKLPVTPLSPLTPSQVQGGGTSAGESLPEAPAGEKPISPANGGSLISGGLPPPPQLPADSVIAAGTGLSAEPGELLVVSADLDQAQQTLATAQQYGYAIKRRSVLTGLGLVLSTFRLPPGTTLGEAVIQLRTAAPRLWTDFNHRLTLQGDAAGSDYATRLVSWPQQRESCGRGLRIGIVDGKVPDSHPAIRGAAISHHNFVTHGLQPAPPEHALAVTALLAGQNGIGLTPAVTLFVAEVMRQRDKRHVDTTVEWLVEGLDWLVQQQVDVVNLSLGGPRNLIMQAAIDRVLALGIPVVAAAGNSGPGAEPVFPAAQDGVVAVTAVDADRRIYRKANRGDYIRFAAPGVDVRLPRMDGEGFVSGTSFASPFVAATLIAKHQTEPGVNWPELLLQLEEDALDLGDPGRDPVFGVGLVQGPVSCGGTG